jgi:hypothetical protein
MLIGSFDIQKENAVYVISNLTTCIENPFFSNLFHSCEYFANTSSVVSSSSSYSLCAKTIVSFDVYIESTQFTITSATLFLHSIYFQIQSLLENNIAISFMDLNDIMVIDSDKFYFCNYNKLYNITQYKTILVTDFYDPHNLFLPPEFIHNNMIPFSTHYTSVYYSLAIVILFCLANSNTRPRTSVYQKQLADVEQGKQQQKEQDRQQTYKTILTRYQHTKMYNTLTQCMIEDPIGRKLFLF